MDDHEAGQERIAGRRLLAVTEEELQRIILDIHDGPVQKLFAALSQVNLLQRQVMAHNGRPDPAALDQGLDRIAQLLQDSLTEIRTFLGTFRPPEFAKRDLLAVLEGLVIQFEAMTGNRVVFDVNGEIPPVSLPVKIALYRILQEALSNGYRHADVKEQCVKLTAEDGVLCLQVDDKGLGFTPPPLNGPAATEREEHIGLRGMRDRIALVGGTFELESQPGQGTRITVKVPIHV